MTIERYRTSCANGTVDGSKSRKVAGSILSKFLSANSMTAVTAGEEEEEEVVVVEVEESIVSMSMMNTCGALS